jgi:hypothetical protein
LFPRPFLLFGPFQETVVRLAAAACREQPTPCSRQCLQK